MSDSSSPHRVCVFLGSSMGSSEAFRLATESVGEELAAAGIELVYGGGTSGLMGVVAKSTLKNDGKVTAVIPTAFLRRKADNDDVHDDKNDDKNDDGVNDGKKNDDYSGSGTTESLPISDRSTVLEVQSMHERKLCMATLAKAFIVLPGGIGTLEEAMEMSTWTQLGIHTKPVIILNVCSFYSPLREMLKNSIDCGFVSPSSQSFILFIDTPDDGNWGAAAIQAIEEWEKNGKGAGPNLGLKWT